MNIYFLFFSGLFLVKSVLLDSPVATLGRYFSFWAGFPNSRMPLKPMDWWAPSVMPTPRSWLPTISTSRAYCEPQRQWTNQSPARPPPTRPCSLLRHQSGPCVYLSVGQAETAQVRRHLQAKGTHLLQPLHGVILYFLQGIVFGRVVHFLMHVQGRRVTGMSRSSDFNPATKIEF